MLDQKDLQAIAELMDCRISKTEEKLITEMDARISEVETNLTNRIDAVEKKVSEVETNLTNRIDAVEKKVSEVETRLTTRIDAVEQRVSNVETGLVSLGNKIDEVESTLAKQLIRTEDILTRRMNKMSDKLEEISEYYRVEKLESGNMGMVLQMLESYNVRLKKLEMGFA